MTRQLLPILTITGSDGTGASGLQADIRTITALGGHALSAVSSLTVQDSTGIAAIHDVDPALLLGQVRSLVADFHPRAVKVGMVRQAQAMQALRDEVVGCRHLVCAPGIFDSHGRRLMDDAAVQAYCRCLLPEAELLVLKCSAAQVLTGLGSIEGEAAMLHAARCLLDRGPRAVMLRGGHCADGLVTGLLLMADGPDQPHFFASPNTEGWQLHGVGGTLSSAIATCLGQGRGVADAVSQAHQYMRSQVVYSASSASHGIRQVELYNRLMELVARHHRASRDVAFYAERLHVTPRYLSDVTGRVAGRSPKQLIADYVVHEICQQLRTSSLTIQQIALHYGFASQAALAKFFHAQRGCSPSDYRESLAL